MRDSGTQSVDRAELVDTWASRSGGTNNTGKNDGGYHVRLDGVSARLCGSKGIRIEHSISAALRFISDCFRRGYRIPVAVGGPGRDIKIALGQLREFGVFVGPEFDDTGDYNALEEATERFRELPLKPGLTPS